MRQALGRVEESESLARKGRIDPRLRGLGWEVVRFDPTRPPASCDSVAIEEYPTANGPADYALCVGGQVLGIVEAKKPTLGPQNVLTQAKRYARGVTDNPLDFDGYRVPFVYATNG